jgi:hypothetical protein
MERGGSGKKVCIQSPEPTMAQTRRSEQMSVNPGYPGSKQAMLI